MGDYALRGFQRQSNRDGATIELSKTEQRLLRVLVENRGHTVPRDVLVERIWTDGAEWLSSAERRLSSNAFSEKLPSMAAVSMASKRFIV